MQKADVLTFRIRFFILNSNIIDPPKHDIATGRDKRVN